MLTIKTDEQLLDLYQTGNAQAFEVLYGRYKNAIYHYFFRQVSNAAMSDELHQDVWLKVIKSGHNFKHKSSFKTWLYTIAHHRLVDYYRHNSKQVLHLVKENPLNNEANEETIEFTEKNSESQPDNVLYTEQMQKLLLESLKALPKEQQEVFILHEKSNLSLKDIAQTMGASFEQTKSRLRYATKKLRQALMPSYKD